jgi:hypothetical protein
MLVQKYNKKIKLENKISCLLWCVQTHLLLTSESQTSSMNPQKVQLILEHDQQSKIHQTLGQNTPTVKLDSLGSKSIAVESRT